MDWIKINFHLLGVTYIAAVLFAAHLWARRPYQWSRNSLSELTAQGYPRNWIMRAGLIGFGLIMTTGIAMKIADRELLYLVDVPVLFYAFAVLLAGIFAPGPGSGEVRYSPRSDLLHSVFAVTAVVAICFALLMSAMLEVHSGRKAAHSVFLVLILMTYAMLGFRKRANPVLQRTLMALNFAWLIAFYNI